MAAFCAVAAIGLQWFLFQGWSMVGLPIYETVMMQGWQLPLFCDFNITFKYLLEIISPIVG